VIGGSIPLHFCSGLDSRDSWWFDSALFLYSGFDSRGGLDSHWPSCHIDYGLDSLGVVPIKRKRNELKIFQLSFTVFDISALVI
jgi:hypothetical protein